MPRRKDYTTLPRPDVSWVDAPASYDGPRMIRIHSGILQTLADLQEFQLKLAAYLNQQATDYRVANHQTQKDNQDV